MKYDWYIAVDAVGRSGGLMLMWKQEVCVDLLNFSCRHINAFITKGVGLVGF